MALIKDLLGPLCAISIAGHNKVKLQVRTIDPIPRGPASGRLSGDVWQPNESLQFLIII